MYKEIFELREAITTPLGVWAWHPARIFLKNAGGNPRSNGLKGRNT